MVNTRRGNLPMVPATSASQRNAPGPSGRPQHSRSYNSRNPHTQHNPNANAQDQEGVDTNYAEEGSSNVSLSAQVRKLTNDNARLRAMMQRLVTDFGLPDAEAELNPNPPNPPLPPQHNDLPPPPPPPRREGSVFHGRLQHPQQSQGSQSVWNRLGVRNDGRAPGHADQEQELPPPPPLPPVALPDRRGGKLPETNPPNRTDEELKQFFRTEFGRGTTCRTPQEIAREILGEDKGSPFVPDILDTPQPKGFQKPDLKKFEGTTDPADFLHEYRLAMAFYAHSQGILCKFFPTCLTGSARNWFTRLEPGSISNFRQLAESFIARFIMNTKRRLSPADLLALKMKPKESLRDYVARFWDMYQNAEGCTDAIAVSCFPQGLPHDSPLCKSLIKKPADDILDLQDRIDKYVRLEDDKAQGTSPAAVAVVDKPNWGGKKRESSSKRKQESQALAMSEPNKAVNTVFTEPIYRIMSHIKHEPYFEWPKRMRSPLEKRDQSLHCSHHRDVGHRTENCISLKKFLQKLVDAGHLAQYVKEDDAPPAKSQLLTSK